MKTNWQTKNFEDCLEKVTYSNKIQRKHFLDSGKFPVISQEAEFINGYWDNEKDLFKVKKPVAIFGDHTQVLKYVDFDFVLGADGVKILQPKDFLDSRFFYYFLQNTNFKNLGYARHYRLLKEKEITYPKSILEQQRIVKKLDELFTKIETAKNNAEKNLQNSKELFESYLQNVFANPKKDWESKRLVEVCEKTSNIKWQNNKKAKFKYVDLSAVSRNDLKITNSALVDYKNAPSRAKKIIKEGDVIFATTRPTLKRIAKIFNEYNDQICSTGFVVLRAKREKIFSDLFFYFLQTQIFMKNMEKLQRGASYPAVSDSDVKNQIILFPKSLTQQKQIVKKLDELSNQTKKLEKNYQQKIDDLDELKKSVLKSAFAGKF